MAHVGGRQEEAGRWLRGSREPTLRAPPLMVKQSVGVGHWPPKSQPGSRSFSLAPVWIIEKSERPGDQVGGCHDLVISNVSVGR